jgi:hypothetical protein
VRISWNDLLTDALAFPIDVYCKAGATARDRRGGTDGWEYRSFRSPAQAGFGGR